MSTKDDIQVLAAAPPRGRRWNRPPQAVTFGLRLAFLVAVAVAYLSGRAARGDDQATAIDAGIRPATDQAGPSAVDPSPPENAAGDASPGADVADHAPPIELLCRAAVELSLAEPERARSLVSRARAAGWLPDISFRVSRRLARTEGVTFNDVVAGTVTPVDIDAIDDVRYEWRATLDLSRIVFNPEELQAHFEALRMADVRRDIQSLVIRLYFERRRLMAGVSMPGVSNDKTRRSSEATSRNRDGAPGGALKDRLRVLEIEAQLDALSGGAFSANQGGPSAAPATSFAGAWAR